MKKFFVSLIIFLSAFVASVGAMAAPLSESQHSALKAVALADQTAAGYIANGNDIQLADWFNAQQTWTVWRPALTPALARAAIISAATQLDSLTVGKRDSLFYLVSGDLNPADVAVRTGIDDLCGSQNSLMSALRAAMKRQATRAEKALSTGTGSDASPATLTWDGFISGYDAQNIRNAP